MRQAIITPDRTNWQCFCQEAPLTEAEESTWQQMARLARENELFASYCDAKTDEEWAAVKANNLLPPTKDWSDLVRWANAFRALKRAQIKAHQDYHSSYH